MWKEVSPHITSHKACQRQKFKHCCCITGNKNPGVSASTIAQQHLLRLQQVCKVILPAQIPLRHHFPFSLAVSGRCERGHLSRH